jgi:hypothetical protein
MPKDEAVLATLDLETDPFQYGRHCEPYAWGFYSEAGFVYHWGDDWKARLLEHLEGLDKPHVIFAHNGGKFDFLFLSDWIRGQMLVINGRIVCAKIGEHEIRDSYALMPVPLRQLGQKGDLPYQFHHRSKRNRHKTAIVEYLTADCVELYKAVKQWIARYGAGTVTMASAAMKSLNSVMTGETYGGRGKCYEKLNQVKDEEIRPFYHGGRVQCFQSGALFDKWKMFDVNSMYPYVMAKYSHPVSGDCELTKDINDDTDFVCFEGYCNSSLPMRTKHGLRFDIREGIFCVTVHELHAAVETGTVKIKRIKYCFRFRKRTNFADFILPLYSERMRAKQVNDKWNLTNLKLLMNSAYGKFGLNPNTYEDCYATFGERDEPPGDVYRGGEIGPTNEQWRLQYENGSMRCWTKPIERPSERLLNVATAASITGAARAELIYALAGASGVAYCDTDSVICSGLSGVSLGETQLGAWKTEAAGDALYIAGPKLYVLLDTGRYGPLPKRVSWEQYQCVKLASKGVRVRARDIISVCEGERIATVPAAPTFKPNGEQRWTKRVIKMTA